MGNLNVYYNHPLQAIWILKDEYRPDRAYGLDLMDKKDVMYMVAALAVVLVIALVIKPMVTGHPVNTGIPVPTTTQQVTSVPVQTVGLAETSLPTVPTSVPTTPSTPRPTWNPNSSQSVTFVNPSAYGISLNETRPVGFNLYDTGLDLNRTTFATIESSTGGSGTTDIMYIPFPYWELVYTVEPTEELVPEKVEADATPTGGTGYSGYTGVSGSYSTARPEFTLLVMDGDDPNRIVRTISPPGGIDLNLWSGVKEEAHENSRFTKETSSSSSSEDTDEVVDPRPWTEKFYEGQRNYFFVIKAQSLDSYKITIQVPTRYIGKY